MTTVSALRFARAILVCTLFTPQASAQTEDVGVVKEATVAPEDLRSRALYLVYSSATPTEATFEGITMLERAVDLGDVDSMVALGDLYLFGTLIPADRGKALDLYEAAAVAGNGNGIHNYGMMLMWDERDPALAEQMLVRAGEMGFAKAWATLAEGAMYGYLLGGRISRAKFVGYADSGRAAGLERIAVLEAIRHMWGISVTASGPETLRILQEAADAGNREAALFIIRLLRDGNKYNVRRDRARAAELLSTYRPLLQDREAAQLEATMSVASTTDRQSLKAFAEVLGQTPEIISGDFGRDLFAANPNAAIYLLQESLHEAGYQPGVADGLAGIRTVSALREACRNHLSPQVCEASVLSPDVISPLISVLSQAATGP